MSTDTKDINPAESLARLQNIVNNRADLKKYERDRATQDLKGLDTIISMFQQTLERQEQEIKHLKEEYNVDDKQ